MNLKVLIVAAATVAMAGCNMFDRRSDRVDRDNRVDTVSDTTSAKSSEIAKDTKAGMHKASAKMGKDHFVLNFAPGSDQLTESSKQSIRAFIDGAKSRGEIEDIHVAVWSDRPFSQDKNAPDLSKGDRDLADRRIKVIDNFLDDELELDADIETYSMAEKSNWFARAFRTDDAELKSLFSQRGAPANVEPEQLKLVRKLGGPMKAVLLVTHDDDRDSVSGTSSSDIRDRDDRLRMNDRRIDRDDRGTTSDAPRDSDDLIAPSPNNANPSWEEKDWYGGQPYD